MVDHQARRGPSLSGITRESGQHLTGDVHSRAGTGRAPGSALITVAAWLLALTGGSSAQWHLTYMHNADERARRRRSLRQALVPPRAERN